MNKTLFYISLFCCSQFNSQTNLVYNGDFEQYSECPTNLSTPGDLQIEKCLGWTAPTYGTSDYFNECASLYVGIPNNFFGNQNSQSGIAYAGFHAYTPPQLNAGLHWWEYLQDSLVQDLKHNHLYFFQMHISLGENQSGICSKNIGAFFSSQRTQNLTSSSPLNLPAQIKSTSYINDTINWVEISGYFIAKGGERYITLGHFSDSNSVDTTFVKYADGEYFPSIYYYVDNVSLIENGIMDVNDYITIPNVFTPNNDEINDVWIPTYNNVKTIEITILNRWGNLVFHTADSKDYWDGKIAGGKVLDGTYFYVVKFETTTNQMFQKKGFIQVINSQ